MTTKQEYTETWLDADKRRDVKAICKKRFGFDITEAQEEIIRSIAYKEHKRIIINCHTRYGKTQSVALAVLIYLSRYFGKRVYIISATDQQANLLRNYIANALIRDEFLLPLVMIKGKKTDRMAEEMSRKRITIPKLRNELITISAQGEARRLMGHGGHLVIVDESCLIAHETYRTKISRMLGDSKDSVLVEISNPWDRNNHYYEHWMSPKFYKIHVGWEQGLKEGRITQEFVDEQRQELTPMEFQVLYESEFPDEGEDNLFRYKDVMAAVERWKQAQTFDFDVLSVGCDIADKGTDETVLMPVERKDPMFRVREEIFSEPKSEQTQVAGRIISMQEAHDAMSLNIDGHGMGVGVLSMVKEGCKNPKARVIDCLFGASPRDKRRFANKKAEEYFRLSKQFEEGLAMIPPHEKLIRDLLRIKWSKTSSGKNRIDDPEKSPDFADALVYATWSSHSRSWNIA